MSRRGGMGTHQSASAFTETWLTPPHILAAFPRFDLDPCAAPEPRPWATATQMHSLPVDGLTQPWHGHVWCNPPYGAKAGVWLQRMAEHNDGVALIFSRTETSMFHQFVWQRASALLFFRGRLTFCRPNGTVSDYNGGAPSVLVAYGDTCREWLRAAQGILDGAFVTPELSVPCDVVRKLL